MQICNHHTDPQSDTTHCNHSNLNYSSMMLGKGKEILQENVVSLIKIHANIITCRWSWYWKYRWCILFLTWLFVLLKKVFFLSGASAYLCSFRPPFQQQGVSDGTSENIISINCFTDIAAQNRSSYKHHAENPSFWHSDTSAWFL